MSFTAITITHDGRAVIIDPNMRDGIAYCTRGDTERKYVNSHPPGPGSKYDVSFGFENEAADELLELAAKGSRVDVTTRGDTERKYVNSHPPGPGSTDQPPPAADLEALARSLHSHATEISQLRSIAQNAEAMFAAMRKHDLSLRPNPRGWEVNVPPATLVVLPHLAETQNPLTIDSDPQNAVARAAVVLEARPMPS
jgi:hypothetical protein